MKAWLLVVVGILLICFAHHVLAVGSGGYNNEVVSAAALGKGNASVAQTDNATSVYFNPANASWLDRPNLTLGVTWERLHTEMTDSARGISEDMKDQDAFPPQAAFGSPIGEGQWAAGITVVAPYGLSTEWSGTGFSKYVATKSEAAFIDIAPVVAFRVNEQLALGAGLDYYVGSADLRRKVSNSGIHAALTGALVPMPDGDTRIEGDGDGLGFNLGVRYEIGEQHALGLAYRSKATVNLDGDIDLSGLVGGAAAAFGGASFRGSADADLDLPQSVTIGYAYRPAPVWVVELDLQWTEWSTYKELAFEFAPNHPLLNLDNPQPKDWSDTWTVGVGAERLVGDNAAVRFGYYYYETPIPNDTFDTVIPDNDRHNLTIGGMYGWGEQAAVDLAYVLVMPQERTVDNNVGAVTGSSVDGTYESLHHLLALSFSYSF